MPITKSIEQEQPKVVKEEVNRILASTPPEVDRGLYEMLEIYGRDVSDPDTQDKVKYISDVISGSKDQLLSIFTELGSTPMGETKLGRVYKYLRLKQQADKLTKHQEEIKSEMEVIKTGIKSNWRTNQWA